MGTEFGSVFHHHIHPWITQPIFFKLIQNLKLTAEMEFMIDFESKYWINNILMDDV